MDLKNLDGICLDSFSEPISIGALRKSRCSGVPREPGVYVILRASDRMPEFLRKSRGGWFKGKDPSVPLDEVRTQWVKGAHVVYVGKAAGRKGLNRRVCQLVDFGSGKAVGHRGGRLLWHLPQSEKLLVRWRTCPGTEADQAETNAIGSFKAVYEGKRPFANMLK
jgi:hypothetical protein